jgi:uncharacterized protein YjbI with pentapeptide repeats
MENLKEVLELHKKWLNGEPDGVKANLSYADLRDANLRDANLSYANLSYADLRDADLRGTNLRDADLRGTNLRDADLRDANLRGTNLRDADLSYADLRDANLRGTNLRDADLDFSCLPLWCGSLLANMDDRQVKQLLYHTLSIVKHSNNVSALLKEQLLTENNLSIAKEFHRANECNKL